MDSFVSIVYKMPSYLILALETKLILLPRYGVVDIVYTIVCLCVFFLLIFFIKSRKETRKFINKYIYIYIYI